MPWLFLRGAAPRSPARTGPSLDLSRKYPTRCGGAKHSLHLRSATRNLFASSNCSSRGSDACFCGGNFVAIAARHLGICALRRARREGAHDFGHIALLPNLVRTCVLGAGALRDLSNRDGVQDVIRIEARERGLRELAKVETIDHVPVEIAPDYLVGDVVAAGHEVLEIELAHRGDDERQEARFEAARDRARIKGAFCPQARAARMTSSFVAFTRRLTARTTSARRSSRHRRTWCPQRSIVSTWADRSTIS